MLDVVILSNSKNNELKQITSQTLNSLIRSCLLPEYFPKIIVVEQYPLANWYSADVILRPDEPFNYNRFANLGAKQGTNEWICIANNDLIFENGWFELLMKFKHPVMSPRCPDDKRQLNIKDFEFGTQVGRHLSGWCFVIKRTLWEEIGGFDEDFAFWCADNSLMEQLILKGIEPMVVDQSIVRHLGSKTLKTMPNREELTVNQVKKYNLKYGRNLFGWGT